MLVAPNHYRDLDEPPRIISEIRKSWVDLAPWHNFKPRLSGDLLVKYNNGPEWWPRRVSISNGQLYVQTHNGVKGPSLRTPLRFLSLQAGSRSNSLSLYKGQDEILSLQAPNEQLFDIWVKTIAIELIRQTPLEAIKYLDIFTLISCWKREPAVTAKDCNFNQLSSPSEDEVDCSTCNTISFTKHCNNTTATKNPLSLFPENSNHQESDNIEKLMEKCQNSEKYVPVKEKLLLFESLCKLGRKTKSSEDVSCKTVEYVTKRTQSMHDLSILTPKNCVREICKYFEIKNENCDNWRQYGTLSKNQKNNVENYPSISRSMNR